MLKFKQPDWMKKHIEFNTEKKKNAANSFEKGVFKLIINSAYGTNNGKFTKKNQCQTSKQKKRVLQIH